MGYREELEKRMVEALEERDALSDMIFNEGRSPTKIEWLEIVRLQAKYESYCELINKFFSSPEPEFEALELPLH